MRAAGPHVEHTIAVRHGGTSGYLSLGAAFLTGTRTGILAELQGRKAFWAAASARTVGRGALSEQAEGLRTGTSCSTGNWPFGRCGLRAPPAVCTDLAPPPLAAARP